MSSAVVTLSHTSARLRCDLQGDNDNDKDKGHSFRQLSVQKALACPEGQICEVLHKPQLGYSFEPTSDIDILRPARSAALVFLKTGGGARCTRTTLKATSSLSRYWVSRQPAALMSETGHCHRISARSKTSWPSIIELDIFTFCKKVGAHLSPAPAPGT